MSDLEHLNDSARALLALPDEERILKIRSERWIGYPRAKSILARLEELVAHPRPTACPTCCWSATPTMARPCWQGVSYRPIRPGTIPPVILVQAPPVPDEGRFYNAILELLFAPYRPGERVDKKQFQVMKLLRYVELKVLVIDEIHHILAGNLNRQRAFLNVLKYLGNELQISIVGVGTRDAFRAIQTDPQLANRFEPVVLSRWGPDNDFLRLLVSFERMLPLRNPSRLHGADLSARLFAMSEGYIGELSRVLTEAAAHAVLSGRERIDLKTLDGIGWTPPSERKRRIDRIY